MDRHHSDHALQDYFDDLLEDASTSPSVAGALFLSEQPAPQSAAATPLPYAEPDFATLEQVKRERLQALLDSKPLLEEPTVSLNREESNQQPTEVSPAPAEVVKQVEQVTQAEQVQQVVQSETVVRTTPAVVESAATECAESSADEVVTTAETNELDASPISQYLSWHENGRPHWAQGRFDALLFDVAGLKLAVPIIALGQIQPLTDNLTPLFGQAKWFMGLLPTPAGKIRTVNTAMFVMPEKYDPKFLDTAKYVVSIDGVPWGLAVDAINQPISLDPEDVKWRSERSKRPWLAGTVKSAMCALLDIPQMGKMLTDADLNAR